MPVVACRLPSGDGSGRGGLSFCVDLFGNLAEMPSSVSLRRGDLIFVFSLSPPTLYLHAACACERERLPAATRASHRVGGGEQLAQALGGRRAAEGAPGWPPADGLPGETLSLFMKKCFVGV